MQVPSESRTSKVTETGKSDWGIRYYMARPLLDIMHVLCKSCEPHQVITGIDPYLLPTQPCHKMFVIRKSDTLSLHDMFHTLSSLTTAFAPPQIPIHPLIAHIIPPEHFSSMYEMQG